ASSAPRVGPGQAWRYRFNLRGPSSLLFEVTQAGPIAVRSLGLAVKPRVGTLGGEASAGRTDAAPPPQWDLAAGRNLARLTPAAPASGPLDLTIGPPGLVPDQPAAKQPEAPVIALGQHGLAPGQQLSLVSGDGPGTAVGLAARTLPADLAAVPVSV